MLLSKRMFSVPEYNYLFAALLHFAADRFGHVGKQGHVFFRRRAQAPDACQRRCGY